MQGSFGCTIGTHCLGSSLPTAALYTMSRPHAAALGVWWGSVHVAAVDRLCGTARSMPQLTSTGRKEGQHTKRGSAGCMGGRHRHHARIVRCHPGQ